MPKTKNPLCGERYRVGYIAVGYDDSSVFWFSSEGVFDSPIAAVRNLAALYDIDGYPVKIPLYRNRRKVLKQKHGK